MSRRDRFGDDPWATTSDAEVAEEARVRARSCAVLAGSLALVVVGVLLALMTSLDDLDDVGRFFLGGR